MSLPVSPPPKSHPQCQGGQAASTPELGFLPTPEPLSPHTGRAGLQDPGARRVQLLGNELQCLIPAHPTPQSPQPAQDPPAGLRWGRAAAAAAPWCPGDRARLALVFPSGCFPCSRPWVCSGRNGRGVGMFGEQEPSCWSSTFPPQPCRSSRTPLPPSHPGELLSHPAPSPGLCQLPRSGLKPGVKPGLKPGLFWS